LRDLFLRSLLLAGVSAAVITELLSPFHLLRRWVLVLSWLVVAGGGAIWLRRHRLERPRISIGPLEWAIAAAITAIAACVGITAWLSPPNSTDAMAYHMPRVIYWAQAGSVAFFPTPYFNQITLPPLAEYLMLHTYVISGGDHFINLVAFGSFLASIVAVSALAAALGLGLRGQVLAALFCATLPNGILQASGAKNDWLLTLFLVLTVYFAMRRKARFAGVALGLTLATKATAYLFAPAPLIAFFPWTRRSAVWLVGGALLINTPQYFRNVRLSGRPLGYDSAQGDGFFRWRNERLGWRPVASNALRHLSDQLGARSPGWNQAVYKAVLQVHRKLGIDPQDPNTTWRWTRYEAPQNANHEANANNRWHLLLAAIAFGLAAARRNRTWLLYGAAIAAGFLLFCGYLKWQPYVARLELPLFVLAAPLGAYLLDALRPRVAAALLCLFLADGARMPALGNWTRPLRGPHSLLRTARDNNYFSDMGQWHNRESYLESVNIAARRGCTQVGIDISENQLEYPFQALLRERNPAMRFVHMGVENASARYYPSPRPKPCLVWCPDCVGNTHKVELYGGMGEPTTIGRFLLWAR
jgi:hypothetical protein